MIQEIWKDIKGYEDKYQVSSFGRVRSLDRDINRKGKILKHCYFSNRYTYVSLCKEGTRSNKLIHRLIAQAFIPNPENYPQINHKNGIKDDNRLENLEWVSQSMNMKHAFKTGLIKWTKEMFEGENNPGSKLNNEKVREIRLKLLQGCKGTELAKEYGVYSSQIYKIRDNKAWKHLV